MKRHRAIVRRALLFSGLAALLVPATVQATQPWMGTLRGFHVADGKAVFVQPSGGLTVLDASTGAVLLRDPGRPDEYAEGPFHEVDGGIVVRSHRPGLVGSEVVDRSLDLKTMTLVWEVENQVPILDLLRRRRPRARLVCRRPSGGPVAWTHQTVEEAGVVLYGKQRLMVTEEDQEQRERRTGTEGRMGWEGPVRRLHRVTLVDLGTGRVLSSAKGLGLSLDDIPYGREPITFDGERVVASVRRPPGHPCRGNLLRVFTVNAEAGRLVSEEECQPAPAAPAEGSWLPSRDGSVLQLSEGSLTMRPRADGVVFAFDSPRGSWRLATQSFSVGWPRVHEGEGKLFLESPSWSEGTLDGIDMRSGRPLWRYVYPSYPGAWLASSRGLPSNRARTFDVALARRARRRWEEVRARPPSPLVPVAEGPRGAGPDAAPSPPAPVLLDTRPFPSRALEARVVFTAWASLIALALGGLLLRRQKPLRPERSPRRVVLAIGVCVGLIVWLARCGSDDPLATVAGEIVLAAWWASALWEGLRVRTRRLTVLARVASSVLVLFMGLALLPLFF